MATALTFVGDWPASLRAAGERAFAAVMGSAAVSLPEGTINLKLVDDAESKALNEQYTGNAYATDVLTFNYGEDGELVEGELADIAISLETAQRQAAQARITPADEVGLLLIHGLLHVAGLDHQHSDDQRRLDKLQAELMASAGLTYREYTWQD